MQKREGDSKECVWFGLMILMRWGLKSPCGSWVYMHCSNTIMNWIVNLKLLQDKQSGRAQLQFIYSVNLVLIMSFFYYNFESWLIFHPKYFVYFITLIWLWYGYDLIFGFHLSWLLIFFYQKIHLHPEIIIYSEWIF